MTCHCSPGAAAIPTTVPTGAKRTPESTVISGAVQPKSQLVAGLPNASPSSKLVATPAPRPINAPLPRCPRRILRSNRVTFSRPTSTALLREVSRLRIFSSRPISLPLSFLLRLSFPETSVTCARTRAPIRRAGGSWAELQDKQSRRAAAITVMRRPASIHIVSPPCRFAQGGAPESPVRRTLRISCERSLPTGHSRARQLLHPLVGRSAPMKSPNGRVGCILVQKRICAAIMICPLIICGDAK